ncbi:MAG: OmpH family outer membrane protein [Pseudomonadota bacterium]
MRRLRTSLAAVLVAASLGHGAMAEGSARLPVASPILTIDSDRLFEDSAFGRQIIAEIEQLGAALSAENRQIEEDLTREERELTELRPTMNPEEFRTLADAFDAKVTETRRTQDAKSRAMNSKLEERRVVFLNAAAPVLEQLMREAGAAVVLERRSVFISSNAVDITLIAIERLNDVLSPEDMPEPKE